MVFLITAFYAGYRQESGKTAVDNAVNKAGDGSSLKTIKSANSHIIEIPQMYRK